VSQETDPALALASAERYIEVGRPERALAVLADLDGETAVSGRARGLRGWALMDLERSEEAAGVAREALADEPEDVELLFLLSTAELQRGELGEAEAAILAALALEPDLPELLCQYADVAVHGGQLDKAQKLIDRAAALDPDAEHVLTSRIELAHLRGRRAETEALTRELLERNPQSLHGQRMLGILDLERGKPRPATERFAEAARGDPSHAPTANAARASRELSRPWWWPLHFFDRVGVAGSWIGAMVVIFGLRAAGLSAAAGIAVVVWIALCAYSWIAGPVLRRRLERMAE